MNASIILTRCGVSSTYRFHMDVAISWIFCVCFDDFVGAFDGMLAFDGVLACFDGVLMGLEGAAVLPFAAEVDVVWD